MALLRVTSKGSTFLPQGNEDQTRRHRQLLGAGSSGQPQQPPVMQQRACPREVNTPVKGTLSVPPLRATSSLGYSTSNG